MQMNGCSCRSGRFGETYGRSLKNSVKLVNETSMGKTVRRSENERGFVMFGFLTFGTTLTVADLAIKNEIEKQDASAFPREMKGTKGLIRLYRNHNPGFSFGFLTGSRAVELFPLCITSGVAGIWAYMMGRRGRFVEKLSFTLVLAGGISNVIDRIRLGYVVDYVSIQWKALKKVVFNLADLFILAGCVMLVAAQIGEELREKLSEILKNHNCM